MLTDIPGHRKLKLRLEEREANKMPQLYDPPPLGEAHCLDPSSTYQRQVEKIRVKIEWLYRYNWQLWTLMFPPTSFNVFHSLSVTWHIKELSLPLCQPRVTHLSLNYRPSVLAMLGNKKKNHTGINKLPVFT